MQLTKEQTIEIFVRNKKHEAFKNRYKYNTKQRWKCISCLSTIYVSFRQYGRNSIFCDECWKTNTTKETMAQYQYMRILKEQQLKFAENIETDGLKLAINI